MTPDINLPPALGELEDKFASLVTEIPESPEKQALSVLHGIVLELWRNVEHDHSPQAGPGLSVPDVAQLWRTAPPMERERASEGLEVGAPAPDFELPDASGGRVRLSDFRGKPVVLVFYPLDWSPGCSQQLDLYQQEIEEFERRGAQILAVSVDSVYSHGVGAAVRGLSFPLLSDFHPKGEVARAYQVWREQDGFSDRALYVIDPQGEISWAHVSPFVHYIPDIYELLEAVEHASAGEATPTEPVTA